MLKLVVLGSANDGNDVKLCLMRNVFHADVGIGRAHDVENLAAIYGVNRVNKVVLASFDFDEDNAVTFHGNDVNFIVAAAPISLYNGIAVDN